MFPSKIDEVFDFLEEIDDKMHEMHEEIKELRKRIDRVLTMYAPNSSVKN